MPCPEKFKETLEKYQIPKEIVKRINEGYEDIVSSTKPKIKGEYFQRATEILSNEINIDLMKKLYEDNACCKGGSRLKASKEFAKKYQELTLEEKLSHIKEVPYMGNPTLNNDNTITIDAVKYYFDGKYHCACSNFNKFKEINVSKNYCFCCGGHFLFHYEKMLGIKLELLEVISSPLDSEGQNSCVLKYQIIK